MSFEITGEYNTATVHGPRELFDESCIEQIQEMVNHEAFVGDDDIAIMSDGHYGSGSVIGFTMPLKDRISPNTVGSDLGCGMLATKLDVPSFDIDDTDLLSEIDEAIRDRAPVGFNVHDRNDYHMINDFPWTACEQKWDRFAENTDFGMETDELPKYPRESYFEDVCRRVEYDQGRAINSMGTLGSSNHFIELGTDSLDNVWCIIHSGSRGIGAAIAEHWQNVATEKTFERNAEVSIPGNEVKYFEFDTDDAISEEGVYTGTLTIRPQDLEIDREAILDDYEGEAIEGKFGQLKSYLNAGKSDASPLDYLEGDEAIGYIKDMIFAQTYASESRKKMARGVDRALQDVLEIGTDVSLIADEIESVHNYVDPDDAIIRKGACRAHKGERLVVPFNFNVGTILARGNGNPDWNYSSAHGAGRAMSRTEAFDRFDESDFDSQVENVFMSEHPVDELPSSYKDPDAIKAALGDSIEVIDRVKPFLSVKAE